MKLMTEMKAYRGGGKTVPVATDASKSFFMLEHDAAAAHALMRGLSNLRKSALSAPSVADGRLVITLLDEMERSAEARMREWGFDSGEAE